MKIRHRLFFLVIILALVVKTGVGQSTYMSGYVITNQLDTLFGFIDNKGYYKNGRFCDFKVNDLSEKKRYYPGQIVGYRFIDGKYYLSKKINLNDTDSSYFMEYLVDGELDLFFIQSKNNQNHFYASKEGEPLRELKYFKGIVQKGSKMYEKESLEYVGTLRVLTQDCPEMQDDILKIKQPTHKKLIRFSKKYHDKVCKDEKCIIYEKKIPKKIILEVLGGYKFLRFSERNTYESIHLPIIGANLYFNNPKFSEKWYFGIGYQNEGNLIIDSTNVSYNIYKIPLSYNYFHPKKGFSPTFSGGMNIRKIEEIMYYTFSFGPGIKIDFGKLFLKLSIELEYYGWGIVPKGVFAYNKTFGLCMKL